ncbi:MAG: ABC transporter ATP-binding protein [Tepidiformaceae bacterium]
MTEPARLEIDHVSFEAGGRVIVDDVTLVADPPATTAILGPSGSGKTTLLRLVAGLERPSAGRIRFGGHGLAGVPPHRRGFGMMFQDFALFPHLDVGENVGFGLRRSGLSRAQRKARVAELLAVAGLTGFERRTTEALSGGERQRVALTRALAPEPALLMLDEPLASLDRTLRERLLLELKEALGRLRVATLYVTHDQLEAFAIADRIAIMDSGRIIREDTPAALHAEPRTPFVARFLGMANVILGERDADGTLRTAAGAWAGMPGEPGPVTLLLRAEHVAPAPSAGDGVVSGVLASRLFQGLRTRVRLETGAGPLEFELPGGTVLPADGEALHLRVPSVQVLEEE